MHRYRISSLTVQGAAAKPIITVQMPRAFSREPGFWESDFFDLLRAVCELENKLDGGTSIIPGSPAHEKLSEAIDKMGLQVRW